jgi:NAD(P)-dependent dehydrogenase (short-subunit alcohol dehydrogenase family)
MAEDRTTPTNPRSQHTSADFGEQKIPHPGRTDDMDVRPDHGESTYRGAGRLQGRRALVTGGDSGIGRAVAIAFAREGADVAIAFLDEEQEDADETARWVRDAGREVVLLPGDVRSEDHCRQLVASTVEAFGGLDILVNNAAYQMTLSRLEELTTEQLERTFHTNVFAMFWLCRFALEHMEAGGCIINTSSIQGYQPSPQLIDYASTKAAIVNFTKNLAQELAERGIRVNSVAPGPIWTPLIPATMEPGKVDQFGQDTPLGRAGQPAELAPAFVFLASQESSYISGEILGVTGGKPLG